MRMRTFWKFDTQTLHFGYIGSPQRSSFVRPECPSGLVLGLGIWRSPVRFPDPQRSFRGYFFVNFGMTWMCLGVPWGLFRMGVGWFWKKKTDGVEK